MAENNQKVELNDEQLEKVSGGSRSSINYHELKFHRAYRLKNATDGRRALFCAAENIGMSSLRIRYNVVINENGSWKTLQSRLYNSYKGFLSYIDLNDYVQLP